MEQKDNGKWSCTKDYPKQFCEDTVKGNDSYAQHRRSVLGEIVDRWIVSYSPKLLLRYNAHINVEICASVKSVKYLYKYCYKGHDYARMVMKEDGKEELQHDEVKQHVDMRYVTPHEANYRLYELTLDHKSHTVQRLTLHLPDGQNIYWNDKRIGLKEKDSPTSLGECTI